MMKKLVLILMLQLSTCAIAQVDAIGVTTETSIVATSEDLDNLHEYGYWLVLRDRFGREVWQEMSNKGWPLEYAYVRTSVFITFSVYGGYYPEAGWDNIPGVPFYVFIDGIRYGAPSPGWWPTFYDDAKKNLLVEGNNSFQIYAGYGYAIGVAEDNEDGDKYLEVRQAMGTVDDDNPAFYIVGDADCDDKVNIADVTAIINYLLGGNVSPFNDSNADIDGNDGISIGDVTTLINYLLRGQWW